jgi:membrane-bound metal-dependent hydrolase YbcI (DUF457 family)
MDIISHGLTGLLFARGTSSAPTAPIATAAVVVGALSPDLDALAKLWDPLASIVTHRVATHSLLGGLALAMIVAGVARAVGRDNFWRLAAFAYLGVMSHVALDTLTPFGTALLSPADLRRWSVGSLHVIDPVVVVILIAGLFVSRWAPCRTATSVARGALVVLASYVLLTVAVRNAMDARWLDVMGRDGLTPMRAAVVPVFPGPWRWLGAAETRDGAVRARFWVWDVATVSRTLEAREPFAAEAPVVEDHPAVIAFLERAKVPWRRVRRDGDTWIIEYEDLAFEDHPLGGPMRLRLRTDPAGAVRTAEFDHRF